MHGYMNRSYIYIYMHGYMHRSIYTGIDRYRYAVDLYKDLHIDRYIDRYL